VAGYLAVVVLTLGGIFFLGYLYGTHMFDEHLTIPMAFHTALASVLLGVGLVATVGSDFALLRPLLGRSVYARLLRAFLPFTAFTVFLVGWVMHMVSHEQSRSSAALWSAVLVLTALGFVSFVCVRIAALVGADLEKVERELRHAEKQSRTYAAELRALNVSLE